MRNATRAGRACLTVVVVFCACPALGSPLTFIFEGELTRVDDYLTQYGYDPLDPSIAVGAPFSGQVSYDPDTAVDLDPDPERGYYELGSSLGGLLGEVLFQSGPPVIAEVFDRPTGDSFFVTGLASGNVGGLPLSGAGVLLGGAPDAFDGDGLPTSIDLSDFPYQVSKRFHLELSWTYDEIGYWIDGVITAARVVPEPSNVVLVLFALCLIRRPAR